MLEERMSVSTVRAALSSLSSNEGVLVAVTIRVEARDLEGLLEALARVEFPINPQIYHEAEISILYPDGRQESDTATLVEFPAYEGRLEEVTAALAAYGFDPGNLQVTGMLDELRSEAWCRQGSFRISRGKTD
jgi:hypothetical protein